MDTNVQFTDTQIIEDAVRTIGGLRLPLEFADEIGNLQRVRSNLIAVLEAKQRAEGMDIQVMDAGAMDPEEIIHAAEEELPEEKGEEMTVGGE